MTQRTLQQVVTAERAEFTDAMMKTARPFAEQLGIELVDVRITKIDLPQQVQDSVFERMRATFKAQAAKLRAEGVEASDRIRAEANKEQTEILADAARQASQTRGQGDASASEVYAKSYSKNAEFYSFYRSMQSYRDAVGTQGDILVIAPDNAYFKYFNKPRRSLSVSPAPWRSMLVGPNCALSLRRLRPIPGAGRNTSVRESGRRTG